MTQAEHTHASEQYIYSVDDSQCIACGACTSLVPSCMRMEDGLARIFAQPATDEARADMTAAFFSCPAAAIRRTHAKR
ncbi:ferredoxin [Burkholderia sp. MS455]|uniref:ferredoxin n=1 Tax=Burkholderia sp. MS455 TaxID=2811788 RepID=UPI00195B29BC|nr:ferredoxin [Burkholderia sp. MS455]QRR07276.1 ferredoxin [Burkholderia sp. MS455]